MTKLTQSNIKYIDPADCGSAVGFRVNDELDDDKEYSSIDVTVDLSDCHRDIHWTFWIDEENHPLEKIDNAIAVLQECRAVIVIALAKKAEHKKVSAERTAAKKAEAKAKDTATKEELGINEETLAR